MSLVCVLSGEVPEVPVISPASGSIFERRLIEKHLADHDTDPVNGKTLTVADLIEIQTGKAVKPRAVSATSIPSLIKTFQDEWDALMLETFKLRQHVETVRQELAHSLYQHDAACRVIARVTRERDQARQALATLQPTVQGEEVTGMEVEGEAATAPPAAAGATPAATEGLLREDVHAKIVKANKLLSKNRKKRERPAELANPEDLAAFTQKNSFPGLHAASAGGISALAVHPSNDNLILTGGMDKNCVLFDRQAEKVLATLTGHAKKVTGVIIHPTENVALSSSLDQTVRTWNTSTGAQSRSIPSNGAVTGISLHPTNEFAISSCSDNSWSFFDLETGTTIASMRDPGSRGLTATQFHPDGFIFGVGTDNGLVRIWDIKEQSNLASFEGHRGKVTAVSFSENGYYLATAAEDATVKLWDLRKLKNFKTISLDEGFEVTSLDFDNSGSYLAVGGTNIQLYNTKSWDLLKTMSAHSSVVTGVRFGTLAKTLISSSMDRSLRVFSA